MCWFENLNGGHFFFFFLKVVTLNPIDARESEISCESPGGKNLQSSTKKYKIYYCYVLRSFGLSLVFAPDKTSEAVHPKTRVSVLTRVLA